MMNKRKNNKEEEIDEYKFIYCYKYNKNIERIIKRCIIISMMIILLFIGLMIYTLYKFKILDYIMIIILIIISLICGINIINII